MNCKPNSHSTSCPVGASLKAFFLLATLLLFSVTITTLLGCASHGSRATDSAAMGPNGGGDDEESDSVGGIGPTLSLRGEREVIRPNDAPAFDWPLDEARMTRGFLLGGKAHWGVDLANKKGTNILSAEHGVVIYTGRGFHGYGNLIVVEHNDEWATLYSHLSKITVKEGQAVARGEKLGEMGRTGHATGVHLHFEIRHNRQPVNPLAYLPEGF